MSSNDTCPICTYPVIDGTCTECGAAAEQAYFRLDGLMAAGPERTSSHREETAALIQAVLDRLEWRSKQ